ncbi:MAG: hypothetical protein LBH44_02860 [Treponema sp.]|jgi:hypothetical protein|nr:hypothetical protein [Treponema sp.]
MLKNGRRKIFKTISIAVMAFYVCYSVVAVSTDICICPGMSCSYPIENNESLYTGHCCAEGESEMDCCFDEIPVQNKTSVFHETHNNSVYRDNISDVQTGICNGLFLVELSGIACEERFIPQKTSYFIFRPPKV